MYMLYILPFYDVDLRARDRSDLLVMWWQKVPVQ